VTFATKISLVALDKLHEALVTNDEGYWMRKNQQIHVHALTPLYAMCHNATILVTIEANDVLPHVLILNYLKYNNKNYFEIIYDIQFKCLDDFIL
jgi:hypothetical protein